MTITVARIIVSVSDLVTSLRLYRDALGLELTYSDGPIARLRTDEPAIEVMLHQRPPTAGEFAVAVSFRVDDVDRATATATAAGASIVDAPADQPWGERQAVLHDPDGHVICLVASTL